LVARKQHILIKQKAIIAKTNIMKIIITLVLLASLFMSCKKETPACGTITEIIEIPGGDQVIKYFVPSLNDTLTKIKVGVDSAHFIHFEIGQSICNNR
jgi:hypothetical protein